MSDYPRLMHTALDALDCRGLAEFYRQLLGLRYRPSDEDPAPDADWLVLVDDSGARVLAVNRVGRLDTPSWPTDDVPKQMHQDFIVDSPEALRRHLDRALELGARLLMDRSDDEHEPTFVLADPEGHVFCLLHQPG